MDYEAAYAIAERAHSGQVDRQGVAYIFHPVRVSEYAAELAQQYAPELTGDVRVAALLHDVLEDTEITAAELVDAGITFEQLQIVKAVTRPEGVTYADFIGLIIAAGVGPMILKLGDITDNTAPARASGSNPGLRKRYAKARVRLEDGLEAAVTPPA